MLGWHGRTVPAHGISGEGDASLPAHLLMRLLAHVLRALLGLVSLALRALGRMLGSALGALRGLLGLALGGLGGALGRNFSVKN